MAARLLPLLCVALAVGLPTAWSIRCWECNSHYDRNCADPFANETFALTDCDMRDLDHFPNQKASVCRKIIQKVREDYRFVRSCGWLSADKEGVDCFRRAGTFNVLIQYCSCEVDGCNSSPHNRPFTAWILVAAAIALLLLTSK